MKSLLRIYYDPTGAMSAILDQGRLLFASLGVVVVTLLLAGPAARAFPGFSLSFYIPLFALAVFYVPGLLLLGRLLAASGGGTSDFRRDYSPLLACTAAAWTAAMMPLALAGWIVPPQVWIPVAAVTHLYFAVLMCFVVRTVFGIDTRIAVAIVSLSWIPALAGVVLWEGPLRHMLGYLASPFFLFYAYYYLGGEIGNLGAGWRSRQHFRRMLEAAAVNPHDGEAQYQLGLVYQQRRQYSEAIQRFQNAVAIDPTETDAHFQLGRIARQQGRLRDAWSHFSQVLEQNEKHSQSEILREVGAVYNGTGDFEDARKELGQYIERRPYDPEGLFYYGQSLEGLNRPAEARDAYTRAIEAARTAPRYRRAFTARWSRQAQKQLRKL